MPTLLPASPWRPAPALTLLMVALLASAVSAQTLPDMKARHPHHATPVEPPPQAAATEHGRPAGATASAQRELVRLPAPMREHMLANMRDHLAALAEIQRALSDGAYDQVARVAEQRLGMSSLAQHGADHMAPLMPPTMRELGTTMHRAASQLAVEAQNSSASGDFKPVLAALARTTSACVACHAAYRVQ
ncbi:MAG: hypothetical protein RL375_2786 [Pseudomonadota bacterium]